MGKTSFFNNGDPQIERSDGKMQPIILSEEDKVERIQSNFCWQTVSLIFIFSSPIIILGMWPLLGLLLGAVHRLMWIGEYRKK